jgi:hypothetical protein
MSQLCRAVDRRESVVVESSPIRAQRYQQTESPLIAANTIGVVPSDAGIVTLTPIEAGGVSPRHFFQPSSHR